MAKIVFSGLIQDMKGSTGATTFGKWKGIHWARLKAASVSNPMTVAQGKIRGALATSSVLWWALTPTQRNLWNEYAQAKGSAQGNNNQEGYGGIIPIPGNLMSGFNAFISVNQFLTAVGAARVSVPPIGDNPPAAVIDSVKFIAGPNLEFKVKSLVNLPKDSYVQFWVNPVGGSTHAYLNSASVVLPSGAPASATLTEPNVKVGHDKNIGWVTWTQFLGDIATGPKANRIVLEVQSRIIDKDGGYGASSAVQQVEYKL